jgi:hypothetical protein
MRQSLAIIGGCRRPPAEMEGEAASPFNETVRYRPPPADETGRHFEQRRESHLKSGAHSDPLTCSQVHSELVSSIGQ